MLVKLVLLEIPFCAKKKNAQIMLDSQNNSTLVPENDPFYFKQNAETQPSCVYQQLNKMKSL